MIRHVPASDVAAMMEDGAEIALVDVREIMEFGKGHPLLAANLPLSALEPSILRTIPRRDTRLVVTDGGDGIAETAATRIARLGYSDVMVLDGGAPAWSAAGQALFPEIEVPAKGFGVFAKLTGKPTLISAEELHRAINSDEDWVVLDSRPVWEYRNGNIPGSTDAAGPELVRCFEDLVPDPNTRVVVNCMSHTRGILGGLSLKAAGVPNDVHVLYHGTRGWLLDGFELERGASRVAGPPSAAALAKAQERAAAVRARAGIPLIDLAQLASWRAEAGRTTYLFDVRPPAEFDAGHVPGAVNAPEGTLIMGPEHYFATRNARLVITDDDTVRATIAAMWMAQLGWGEVCVLADGLKSTPLETGPTPPAQVPLPRQPESLTPASLAALLEQGAATVVDVGWSDVYEGGHIAGALWCLRPKLAAVMATRAPKGRLVLTSEDGMLAQLAAADLLEVGHTEVTVLAGGNAAWQAAGQALTTDEPIWTTARDDHWVASSERPGDVRENVVAYLDWEVGLLDDIKRGGQVPYRNLIWDA